VQEREAAQKQDAARPDPKGEEAQQESSKQEFLSPASSVTDDVRSITSTGSVYYDADDDLHMPNAEQHTPKKKVCFAALLHACDNSPILGSSLAVSS
jgi:hypothetical protein